MQFQRILCHPKLKAETLAMEITNENFHSQDGLKYRLNNNILKKGMDVEFL